MQACKMFIALVTGFQRKCNCSSNGVIHLFFTASVAFPDAVMSHLDDPQAMNFSDRRKSKSGKDVRYISLKPLAKKERKRQQRLVRQVPISRLATNYH